MSGITITERTPSRCDASWSTLESARTSSQRCVRRVRIDSPERPDAASIREPKARRSRAAAGAANHFSIALQRNGRARCARGQTGLFHHFIEHDFQR